MKVVSSLPTMLQSRQIQPPSSSRAMQATLHKWFQITVLRIRHQTLQLTLLTPLATRQQAQMQLQMLTRLPMLRVVVVTQLMSHQAITLPRIRLLMRRPTHHQNPTRHRMLLTLRPRSLAATQQHQTQVHRMGQLHQPIVVVVTQLMSHQAITLPRIRLLMRRPTHHQNPTRHRMLLTLRPRSLAIKQKIALLELIKPHQVTRLMVRMLQCQVTTQYQFNTILLTITVQISSRAVVEV